MFIQQQQQQQEYPMYTQQQRNTSKSHYASQPGIYNTSQGTNLQQQQQQQQQIFQFKHPFTANVSVPTSCGKTYCVKSLLQNCLINHNYSRIRANNLVIQTMATII
jgi:hypothetical protein